MNPIAKAYWIARGVGWDNVPRRLYQSFAIRSGLLLRQQDPALYDPIRCPLFSLSEIKRREQWDRRAKRFFPLPNSASLQAVVPRHVWEEQVVAPIQSAWTGNYPMFSHWTSPIGWPPNFNRDETNQIDWPIGPLWPKTTKSGGGRDDIKLVWEPSRLSLLYSLARAYRYDGDEAYANAIWSLIESWVKQNPVNQTVAWGCGQEIAFRLMAVLFSVVAVLDSPATTSERLQRVDVLAWQSAKRIASNINYAISQENNHALSEAVGLWTVGLLFPEFSESAGWRTLGKTTIETEIKRQIYDDGSYVQHSMSYHRVMLDDMLWAIQLGANHDEPLSRAVIERVSNAVRWLDQFVDDATGRVPNLGSNDGANILPLSCTDYLDYRPVLLAASSLLEVPVRNRDYGLAVEKQLWLTGEAVPRKDHSIVMDDLPSSWDAPDGGYAQLWHLGGYILLKGSNYRDRPGQCDMQHVDLWHANENILRDGGSFFYYHRDPEWKKLFYSVASHNSVQVSGHEQMTKGPNFLWFNWPLVNERIVTPSSVTLDVSYDSGLPYRHRRQIERGKKGYVIRDQVETAQGSAPNSEWICRWRLSPNMEWTQDGNTVSGRRGSRNLCRLRFETKCQFGTRIVQGWESLYYGIKSSLPVVEIRLDGSYLETQIECLDDHQCPDSS